MVKILSIKQQQTWLKSIKNKKGKAYFSGKITGKTSKDFKSAVKSYQSYLKSKGCIIKILMVIGRNILRQDI